MLTCIEQNRKLLALCRLSEFSSSRFLPTPGHSALFFPLVILGNRCYMCSFVSFFFSVSELCTHIAEVLESFPGFFIFGSM